MKNFNHVCILFLSIFFYSQHSLASYSNNFDGVILQAESETIYSDCSLLKRKCEGTKKWKNGDQYTGTFRFGKPNGYGKFIYGDGGYYEGEFQSGIPHGFGKMVYQDDSVYEGEWFNGSKHGEGNYSFSCGDEFFGEFQQDKIEGKGTILFSSGESYSGSWKNSMTHGLGSYSRLDGSQYLGYSLEGKKDGEGMVIWNSGDTLKGNWVDGRMEDDATFIFNDGSSLVTFWEEGIPLETAIYITPDGENIQGSRPELATLVITKNYDLMESVETNLQLAHYGFAMEYKSNDQYEEAIQALQMALSFEENDHNTKILERVNNEFTKIKSEQNRTGVASTVKY